MDEAGISAYSRYRDIIRTMEKPTIVSLFCGAGGESAGKELAFQQLGLQTRDMLHHAVNHWDLAVMVHGKNFPHVWVHQEDITVVTAADYGLEHINLLWASPSCVHHSRARGGKPKDDQQRAHAWEVLDRWLRVAVVDVLIIENVTEFADWGPLDKNGHPIKKESGKYFKKFISELKELGYSVEWKVLCAADYGDPTSRRRLFLQAVRDGYPIVWPEATHRDPRKPINLFNAGLSPWRTAAECIDFSIPGKSIFDRKKPLAKATLERIAAGVKKFVLNGDPFIVSLRGTGEHQLANSCNSVNEPLSTISAGGNHHALVTAHFINCLSHGGNIESLNEPLKTITANPKGGDRLLVSVFLSKYFTGVVGSDLRDPMPTVTAVDHNAMVEVVLSPENNDKAEKVAAFLIHYYGNSQASSIYEPLGTVTTKDRHALVVVWYKAEPYYLVDIRIRMLKPHELAKAMGFSDNFKWEYENGTPLSVKDIVKMIGNACPVNTVAALIRTVVERRRKVFMLNAS